MIVRIRSSQGMLRVDTTPEESVVSLLHKVAAQLKIQPDQMVFARDVAGTQIVPMDPSQTLQSQGIKHGDILFVGVASGVYIGGDEPPKEPKEPEVVEDPVDVELAKAPGRIPRKKASSSASAHSSYSSSMRMEDLPIEPYDENYLAENKIKHMSFHAYIRKLQDRLKGSSLSQEKNLLTDGVSELIAKTRRNGRTKLNIREMAQPIFLERQPYRHVDHVEFESSHVVNTFLQGWRESGDQRFGYLYGRYEVHNDVPLGIKAVVSCIYEPPQQGNKEGVELDLPDPNESKINALAEHLGMRRVGMIYTDLHDDGTGKGKVLYNRNADTYFLSSPEIVFAASHQHQHPSPCRFSDTKVFGSKFVTVVISGNEQHDIELEGYQVSNQCVAMVAADLCQATVEATIMRVKESTDEVYVPDVLFKNVNEFGTTFMHTAAPTFPVEHFIVNVGHGFPKDPKPSFRAPNPFPLIENRRGAKNYSALKNHLSTGQLVDSLSDFHLLVFILLSETFDLEGPDFPNLLEAVRDRNQDKLDQVTRSASWRNFSTVMNEAAKAPSFSNAGPSRSAPASARAEYGDQLKLLKEMGFHNENLLLDLLHSHKGRIEGVLQVLTNM